MRVPVFFPSLPDLEEPIRAELFSAERLEQHAESLAAAQVVASGTEPRQPLLPRVDENGRVLRRVNRMLADAVRDERWITPAGEWLLDNFFIVDAQLRGIRADLPPAFYRELPALREGPLAGYPRVYGIAWAFVAHTDSRFDPELLRRFVRAYQRVQPLTIGELWAVAISLRVVLVENLRRVADAMTRSRDARRQADALADELLDIGTLGAGPVAEVMSRDESPRLVTAFAVELVQRLRDRDPAVTPALVWLTERLAAQGTSAEEIALVEHQRQAAMTVTVRNIIVSMRHMSALDWPAFFESVSLVDDALREGSEFAAMDFNSRDSYRHAIESLARRSGHTELEVTRAALEDAAPHRGPAPPADPRRADPGYYLVGNGRRAFERRIRFRAPLRLRLGRALRAAATPVYLGTIALLTLAIVAVPLRFAAAPGLAIGALILLGTLALIPASDLALALLNRIVTTVVLPALLPRLEWKEGVPPECRTLVAVPTLFTSPRDVDDQIERLEVHYLANPDGDVSFALVSDFADGARETLEGDDAILAAARAGIARLNARHTPPPGGVPRFYFVHRRRLWNASEGVWMGWERKRGKLHELNRLLRGAADTTFLPPDAPLPAGVRYVVTLDADTRLPLGAVHRLVGTMRHPLNQPRLDPASGRVVEGYAVLQPRVTAPLPGHGGSRFQRMISGASGIDPYAAAVSDVYQDLFGEGSYTGKGIYDVDAFEAAMHGRVPENTLLSHDLFEGLFARAGLVTDVELFESAPANYLTAAARQYRWARGDWQLLRWILRERFPAIHRWKMIDNLRRTLSMPAVFLTLLASWTIAGAQPALWTVFVFTVAAIPPLLPVLAGIWPRVPGISKRSHLRAVARDVGDAADQISLVLISIPNSAWLMSHAIVRTLWRLAVTRRRLLEWRTSHHAATRAARDLSTFYRRMAGAVSITLAAALAVLLVRPASAAIAAPFLLIWLASPGIAWWLSRTSVQDGRASMSAADALALRLVARRTWDYFATFVTTESRSLPPDNFQETPQPVVAHRTSPTNIGLYLLATLAARDFGWLGTLDAVDRIEATLAETMALERYRGHLFNWYDTTSGQPLEPRYVSSVDSGNLAASLIALANGCEAMMHDGSRADAMLAGIADSALLLTDAAAAFERADPGAPPPARLGEALDVVRTIIGDVPASLFARASRLTELDAAARTVADRARDLAEPEAATTPSSITARAAALRAAVETHARDLDELMPWCKLRVDEAAAPVMARFGPALSLAELPDTCAAALRELAGARAQLVQGGEGSALRLRQVDALASAIERSAAAAGALGARLGTIAATARAMVAEMDFRFLFDRSRMLFSIGYRMTDRALDEGRYDMLASEARCLSFIAIAKGDAPSSHWFRLGRLLTPVHRDSVLMSWSGSMFEYLMPTLIFRTPVDSLLDQTCRLVVQRQIDYGEERGVPWGISESGYFARDVAMNFQYSAFGIPGLGLRRGLADDIVVTPYATALAALYDPAAARRNLMALAAQGGDGEYGFCEAIDYTPSRLPEGATHEVVRAYMAHHQAMTIVAIDNALNGLVMQDRFHAEPMVRATELLLQERTPRDVPVARPRVDAALSVQDVREMASPGLRYFTTPQTAAPRAQLLSNGRYAVMITAAGSGYSHWRDLAVTRWRPDVTCDDTGAFIFLRDAASGERWSAGFQPTGAAPEAYEVSFTEDRAEITRRDGAIVTRLEVIVSSEDDAEVRRVSITNAGARSREIDVTSYAEVVLARAAADHAHPAFSNLFIQTESVPELDTLLATRRPRSADEREIWLAHVLAVEGETVGDLQWETDRAHFLGRGRHVRSAIAESDGRDLSNSEGAVLDPIVSLRRRVRIRPGRTVHVAFSTIVAATRAEALDLADKYHDVTTYERAATLAWTQAQVQLHHLGIDAAEAHLFQALAGSILFADRALSASAAVMARRTDAITSLWVHGISGDLPVVLVKIDSADDVGIVRQLLRAHAYWRLKRLAVDLVILNDRAPSYLQDLQTILDTLVRSSQSTSRPEAGVPEGRVFTLRSDQITAAQQDVIESVARVVLSNRRGSLTEQVQRGYRPDGAPGSSARSAAAAPSEENAAAPAADMAAAAPDLEFPNGMGGFDAGGREYVIALRPDEWTPAPWINVLANPAFGALVSESGSGCTWSENSQTNQLTTWSNDPVCDPPGDMLYVHDEDSGDLWSATPLPIREAHGKYIARHGHGYTRHGYDAHGIALDLLQFVAAADPIKIARLTLTNHSERARRLEVTSYLDWVLGASRAGTAPFVSTEIDAATGAMFTRNTWSADFGARVAFADLGGAQTAFTADRTEFLGRNGSAARPAALVRREKLSGRTGAIYDPCAALQTTVDLAPGAHATVVFFLGQGDDEYHARELVQRWRAADLDAELERVTREWARLLKTVEVQTPDRALDVMLNQWLLYQTLASRVWGRTGFYQASGGYGFRDQLQDGMALAVGRPDLTRAHILRAAARQFPEGDVQHWWHEPKGRGVRTRIVDDRLWLAYATDHYVGVTGDRALLDEAVPFLQGPPLAEGQIEAYFEPRIASEGATVYEHCARAIDRSLDTGAHGLPLMGTGDWNDGMSRVGVAGKGESVWMAWFLCDVLAKFAPIAVERGDAARASAWRTAAQALARAGERAGWDGRWYRRAYFDDGTPLGTRDAEACAIDSIAQSWAVISGAAPRERARLAMESLAEQLVRPDDALILLLTPPFDHTALEPGYIKGYVPGVRENGGQYTHAAAWAIIAFAELGDGDRAGELMRMLNPIHRAASPGGAHRYRIEPYVVPGDVYAAPHAGRGGWSWYTGSAAWLYRAGIEWMLGLRVRAGRLTIDPCIPKAWPGFSMTFRWGDARYEISVENPHGVSRGVRTLEIDGAAVDGAAGIALATQTGVHPVRVVLGPPTPAP